MNTADLYYMRQAMALASASDWKRGNYRICAIASCKGKFLAWGRNSYVKTHPVQAMYARMVGMYDRTYLHAEIHALIRAKHQVTDVWVARVLKDGSPGLARPCPICRAAMRSAGVERVWYTTNADEVICEEV